MPKAQALKYIGPVVNPGEGVPTPQGWPAEDHEEPDAALAKEKLASPFYKADIPVTDRPVTGGGE